MMCVACDNTRELGDDACPVCADTMDEGEGYSPEHEEDGGVLIEEEESVTIPVPTSATNNRNALEQMGRYLAMLSLQPKTYAEAIVAYEALQRVMDMEEGYNGDLLRQAWKIERTR